MATNEPMTDNMLDAINDLLHDGRGNIPDLWVSQLFDEACRARAHESALEAENATMRDILQIAVWTHDWCARTRQFGDEWRVYCLECQVELWPGGFSHRDDCVVQRARELLGVAPAKSEAK